MLSLFGFGWNALAKAIVDVGLDTLLSLIGDGVRSLLDALLGFLATTTDPVFSSGWWTSGGETLWLQVVAVAGSIMAIALMLAALEAMWSGTVAPIARALGALPMAVVKTAALVSVTSLLVSGTDQVADAFDGSILGQLTTPTRIAEAIAATGLIGIIFALVLVLAVLALWAELAVRASVIYLVVMAAPMILAASIHPKLRGSWTKLAEIGAAVIFSKILVALAISIAFSELAGISASPSFAEGIGALVAGIATLGIACFAPFVLFRLFALEVSHLEGLSRRPVRAARDAQQLSYYHRGSSFGSFLNRHGSEPGTVGGAGLPPGGGPMPGGGPSGGGGTAGTGGAAVPAGALLVGGQRLASAAKEATIGGIGAIADTEHGRGQDPGALPRRARETVATGPAAGSLAGAAVVDDGAARAGESSARARPRRAEERTGEPMGSAGPVGCAAPTHRLDEHTSPGPGISDRPAAQAARPARAPSSSARLKPQREHATSGNARRSVEPPIPDTGVAGRPAGRRPPADLAGGSLRSEPARSRTGASATLDGSYLDAALPRRSGRAAQTAAPSSAQVRVGADAVSPRDAAQQQQQQQQQQLSRLPHASEPFGAAPPGEPRSDAGPPLALVDASAAIEQTEWRSRSQRSGADNG
jgi:hypothetical protein